MLSANQSSPSKIAIISVLLHVLIDQGDVLPAGSIILSGAAMVAIDMRAGNTITHVAEKLGSVSVKCA